MYQILFIHPLSHTPKATNHQYCHYNKTCYRYLSIFTTFIFFCDDVSHQALNNGNKELCAFCFTLLFPMYMIMIIKTIENSVFFLFCFIFIYFVQLEFEKLIEDECLAVATHKFVFAVKIVGIY